MIDIKRAIRKYYELLYAKRCDHFDEMDKSHERYKLPKVAQEEIDNLNSPKSNKDIEFIV